LFFTTDTGKIWRDNGATWDDVTPGGVGVPTWVTSSPDTPPASPTTYDDEFDAATLNARWTNSAAANFTASFGHSSIILNSTYPGSGSPLQYIYQTVPAQPWQFTAKLAWNFGGAPATAFVLSGLVLVESATGKCEWIGDYFGGAGASAINVQHQIRVCHGTVSGTISTIDFDFLTWMMPAMVRYYQVGLSGTTLTWSTSIDGIHYGTALGHAVTTNFTSGPDRVGLGTSIYAAADNNLDCDWFRKTA